MRSLTKRIAHSGGHQGKSVLTSLYQYRHYYLMVLPGLLFFVVFHYLPIYGLTLAFKSFMYNKGIWESPWIGLTNFRMLFSQPDFWVSFKNTLIISFGKILTGFPVPIILSLLMNELRNQRFKKIIQSIVYLPHFLSWVIISGIIFSLFSVSIGAIPQIMDEYFHVQFPRLIANPKYFLQLVFISNIWKNAGWGTILYMAAIAGIDDSVYEAAAIDGARRWQRIWFITLPNLKYAMIILLILDFGKVMNAGFDQIFNLYDASVYSVGDIIDTYVYRLGIINGRFELSTAAGLFKAVINCILLFSADTIVKSINEDSIFA